MERSTEILTKNNTLKNKPIIESYPKNISPDIYAKTVNSKHKSVWGKDLLSDVDFQLLMWPFLIFGGVWSLYINNITTFITSYIYFDNTQVYTISSPFISTLGLFMAGLISDWIAPTTPRYLLMLFGHVFMTCGIFLLTFWGSSEGIFFISMFITSIGSGVMFSVLPTMLSELYGVHYFGRNWGGLLVGNGLSTFIYQYLFGHIYDHTLERFPIPYNNCFGPHCYYVSLTIVLATMFLGLLLDVVLLKRLYHNYQNYDKMVVDYHGKLNLNDVTKSDVTKA